MIHASSFPDGTILAAHVIFLASYVVFAIGKFPGLKVDRTGAAIIGAVAMVAFRTFRTETSCAPSISARSCSCSR